MRENVAACGQSISLSVLYLLWFGANGCVVLYVCRGRTELGDVTVHNINQLKRLNQVIFPVTYNDKFYKDVLEVGELAKLGK